MIRYKIIRIRTRIRFLLIIIVFGLLILACSPLKKYSDLQEVKDWEPEIAKFEALDKSEKYPSDAIMFAGSSSIRLWTTLAEDMKPYSVIQRGYGGSKLSDFAVYADRIFSPHPCRALVMFIANDITGTDKDKTPEEVQKLFLSVLKTFRKTNPDAPFFWIAVTPTESRWKVWPQIREVNRLIKESCEKNKNTYFIETEKEFLNEKGEPRSELFVADKLHLNKDGYVVWNRIVKSEIEKVLGQVKIIAHRGASYLAPENTVAASRLAWSLNADAVETDIYLTKDNKVICSHDGTTKRTTGQDYKISETGSEVLRALDAGSWKSPEYKGEKLPFLEDLIKVMPKGKELVVEIKCGPEVLPYLKPIIEKNRNKKAFTFISFDLNTISETKKTFPDNPCYWLCSNKELLAKNFELIGPAKLEGISLSWNIIDSAVMKRAESLKMEVYTWTVDDPAEAKRLVSLGVKGITTNRPGWLEEQTGIY